MVKVAVLGASGYAALEAIKILLRHPQAELVACVSRKEGAPPLHEVHPSLYQRTSLTCEELDAMQLRSRGVSCVFSCLPHGASREVVGKLLACQIRVIDLSADYRLEDIALFKKWYGEEHGDAVNLAHAVYGLPELNKKAIAAARLVANPGCYSQTGILGLAPLLAKKLIDPKNIIMDSKSGVSGAGRDPKPHTHFPECNESVSAYQVGMHRHTPEMEQALSKVAGESVHILFSPHLIPMDRGIFSTIYARPLRQVSQTGLNALAKEFYQGHPFVRIVDRLPSTKDVTGTNYLDLHYLLAGGHVVVLAVLDNLIRGASGVAVQNFNLMHGFPETEGL
ncbi:MAG: N-acetyl-gamma-glutamyl-phosphate reductase [Gemmataceae bacterium]|nr:N-acetyl-gamma-glutamyl-phosphate reductase [Gemmataceae bacterium]